MGREELEMSEEIEPIEPPKTKGWPSLTPLLYLIVIAAIAGIFHVLGVPKEVTFLIIGAGLTRVKVSSQ